MATAEAGDKFVLQLLGDCGSCCCSPASAASPASCCSQATEMSSDLDNLNTWDFALMKSEFGDLQTYDSETLVCMYCPDSWQPWRRDPDAETQSRSRSDSGQSAQSGRVSRTSGRTVKKSQSRQLQLWQFLYELLLAAQRSPLQWEDEATGVFRIVQPTRLAEIWGRHRNRSNMTYEKMSRTLRYYYEKKLITKVTGKQHTYRFHYDRFPQ